MSNFCVYGVTPESVKKRAEAKARRDVNREGKGMSESERMDLFRSKRDEHVAEMLNTANPARISRWYSCPQRCEEFIHLAGRSGGTKLGIWYRKTIVDGKKKKTVTKAWTGVDQ